MAFLLSLTACDNNKLAPTKSSPAKATKIPTPATDVLQPGQTPGVAKIPAAPLKGVKTKEGSAIVQPGESLSNSTSPSPLLNLPKKQNEGNVDQ